MDRSERHAPWQRIRIGARYIPRGDRGLLQARPPPRPPVPCLYRDRKRSVDGPPMHRRASRPRARAHALATAYAWRQDGWTALTAPPALRSTAHPLLAMNLI